MDKITKKYGPHNIDIYSLIFGSLLGDSYAEKRNGSTRMILQQEESNVSYLMWFHNYLAVRGYCSLKKPKLETRIGKNNKVRFFYRIRTYSFASFNWIYDAFYADKIKKVPKELDKYLTPLALAVWIMDDGTPCTFGLKIYTKTFKEEDVLFLCDVLNKKYNLLARFYRDKHQFVIYIPKTSMARLSSLVSIYMPPSMHRKLKSYSFV
uniref:Putative intron-encoded protein n=1 Tax=Chaetosphaeridium globosum TaxID=96477 RepID=Q8M1E0_CHAGL|nr:putative intron-encoded protein [Chaetosphaeridium globosum]AAM96637.1 putative intron-encoded protein [Chaetosphaeridium globosum]